MLWFRSVTEPSTPDNRLLELRERADLPRVEVAARLRIGEHQVRRWEANESLIPTKHLAALTELLDCSVEHLMGWDRQSTETPNRAAA